MEAGVHLRRSDERADEVDALAAALARDGGGRVGLGGMLADLNRRASAVRVPASAARWGFRWNNEDARSRRWWPQGISTSADHDESGEYDGRRVVLTSWYSKDLAGVHRSEEHTSELQSLMRISYAVFCLKKKNKNTNEH